jgi:hypothetical protein
VCLHGMDGGPARNVTLGSSETVLLHAARTVRKINDDG